MTLLLGAALVGLGALGGFLIMFAVGREVGYREGAATWAWVPREGAYIVRSSEAVTMERIEQFDIEPPIESPKFTYTPGNR